MKCWKCGAEVAPGMAFCSSCGAAQNQAGPNPAEPAQEAPRYQSYQTSQTPPPPPPSGGNGGWTPAGGGASGGNLTIVLTIFAAICAMVYGGTALRSLFYAVRGVFSSVFGYGFHFIAIIYVLFNALTGILGLAMCAILVMTALRRTPQNSDGLLVCTAGIGAVQAAVQLVLLAFVLLFARYNLGPQAGIFCKTLVGAAVAAAGVYLIERFLLGENPIVGKNMDDLKADVQYTFSSLGQAAGEVGAQASQAAENARAEREARAAQQAQYNQQQAQYAQQNPQYQYAQQPGQTPPMGYAPYRVKADRSLVAYILLSLITCGIYQWYFIYALARDVNTVCAGDGKSTAGLIKLLLLSFITCGFYSLYWYYSLGNRLAYNAPRYGLNFQENGTTVLLWDVVGALVCGIGPFVAMHIIIKNTNSLCGAYNYQHGI